MEARITQPAMAIPDAMAALQALGAAIAASGIPETTVELVNLRASQINGCGVCLAGRAKARGSPARPTSASSRWRPGGTRRTSPTPSAPRLRSAKRSPA